MVVEIVAHKMNGVKVEMIKTLPLLTIPLEQPRPWSWHRVIVGFLP